MPWPISQDYNEAIQSPQTSFADSELKAGEPAVNALGIPMPCSGNFADVYRFNCPANGRSYAVKCFTRQIPGLRERYRHISQYLERVKLPFMVDFTFLEQGIRIRGDWFPVLKMQWVEGFTLNQFVRENLEKPQILEALCQIWLKLARRMREANFSHCDLQHGNVLLVPGSKAGLLNVKLVDYDGMWVPAIAATKANEVGHPAYQHPQRLHLGICNLDVDRFPHLVIYTALRGLLTGRRALWDRFDIGDNMLFTQKDFETPDQSPLFQQLRQLPDLEVQQLAQLLGVAARRPMVQVPLLDELPIAMATTAKAKPAAALTPAVKDQFAEPAAAATFVPVAGNQFADLTEQRVLSSPRRKTGMATRTKLLIGGVVAAVAVGVLSIGGVVTLIALKGGPGDSSSSVASGNRGSLPPPSGSSSTASAASSAAGRGSIAWDKLDTKNAKIVDGVLRIMPNGEVRTKEEYERAIEIEVEARTDKHRIRLYAYNGASVMFNWESNPKELRVINPDGVLGTATVKPLEPKTWYKLRWRIDKDGMEVSVNDKKVYSETKQAYNLAAKHRVSISTGDNGIIDVKSFKVTEQ